MEESVLRRATPPPRLMPSQTRARWVGRAGGGGTRRPSLALMRNPVMHYEWGSLDALADLQGRAPSGVPEAELWMGAHPFGPSFVLQADGREVSLADAIEAQPEHLLGPACVERFGPRLPFLLKILAVDQALSVQVHPDDATAGAGHAEESRRRIPRSTGARRYVDSVGKPEQLVALTPVQLLAGLRPAHRSRRLLELLAVPELLPVALLAGTRPDKALLTLGTLRPRMDDDFARRCTWAATSALSNAEIQRDPDAWMAMCWVIRLAAQHPGDPFVVAPLILATHRVEPGESLSIPPGTVHTYLEGLAVEVSGASDNVARAGLTSKHVDLDLVAQWLDPAAQPTRSPETRVSRAHRAWPSTGAPYQLVSVTAEPHEPGLSWSPGGRPAIVCCVRGQVDLSAQGHDVRLEQGQSAFVGADVVNLALFGDGQVFIATADPGEHGEPESS